MTTVDLLSVVHRRDGGYAWFACIVMALCLTFSYMDRTVLSLLIVPIEHDFGLNDTTLSLLQGTAFGLFYSVFGVPLARLADNSNRRNLIIVGVLIWCAATLSCGLCTSAWQLFLARVCVAAGEAVLMPAAVSIIADYFTHGVRSRALNVYSMGIYLGGGLSLALGGLMLKNASKLTALGPAGHHGASAWRFVFIGMGAMGLLLVPLLLSVKEPTRLNERGDVSHQRFTFREVVAVFARYRAAVFTTVFGFALISLSSQAINAWMPTLFIRNHHWSTSGTGLLLGATTLIAGPLGALTGGFISDGLTNRGLVSGKLITGMTSALGCAISAVLLTSRSDQTALAGAISLQFIVAFNFGTVQAALTELLPNRARGLATSMYVAAANMMNALLGPLSIGFINDHVLHDPMGLPVSIRVVGPTIFVIAAVVFVLGLRAFREGVLRQRASSDA